MGCNVCVEPGMQGQASGTQRDTAVGRRHGCNSAAEATSARASYQVPPVVAAAVPRTLAVWPAGFPKVEETQQATHGAHRRAGHALRLF